MKKQSNLQTLFSYDGDVSIGTALPLSLQHVIAMVVGCITPAIIIASAAQLSPADSTLLIQMSLIGSGLTSLLMLYPIAGFGSKLPVIFGVSFAYVPTMIAIATQYLPSQGSTNVMAIIFGAQIIGALSAILFGLFLDKILPLFPPIVAGTVVLVIGISLYQVGITYMGGAGAVTEAGWGAWQNWFVGGFTLIVAIGFSHFGRGMIRLSSLLFAMILGYIVSYFFGMIDLAPISEAGWVSGVSFMHFGIKFDLSAIISITIIYIVTAIELIGDTSSATMGGMNRMATDKELRGGLLGYGLTNLIGSLFSVMPTATFSQNVGIVSTNKVINRKVFSLASFIIIISGLIPKLAAFMTTIPYPVLGGATLSVFAAITMNGIKMITRQPLTGRNTAIVGISVALGVGFTTVVTEAQFAGISFLSPELHTAIGSSPVVLATISAVLMNLLIPENIEDKPVEEGL